MTKSIRINQSARLHNFYTSLHIFLRCPADPSLGRPLSFCSTFFAFLCGAPQIRDRAAPHIDTFSLHYYAVPRRFVTGRPLSLSRLAILLLDQAQLCASSCSISRHLPPPAPHERGSNHSKLCPPINSPFLSDPISYAPRGVPTPSSPSGEMSPK
jgi:hypothetical protein